MSRPDSRSISSVRRRLSSVLLVAAVATGLVAVSSGSVSAEFDTVTTLTPSNPGAYSNRVDDVSCVSTSFCMSVGYGQQTSNMMDPVDTFLTKWDGGSWSLVSTSGWPTGFRPNDIACGTTTSCLVTGGVSSFDQATQSLVLTPYLMLWNGSVISQVTLPTETRTLNAASCASGTFCLVVGDTSETPKRKSLVLKWNGTTLTRESSSFFSGDYHQFMMDVDCDTSMRCVGITRIELGGGNYAGEVLDRGAVAGMWSRLSGRSDSLTNLETVDCQPGELGLCAIVGTTDNYARGGLLYDLGGDMANKFRNVSFPVVPSGGLTNAVTGLKMACVSITRCLLIGDFMIEVGTTMSYAAVWNGSTWTRLTTESGVGGASINDLSCPTASQCIAVGSGKTTSGMMAPRAAMAWFIRDAAQVAAPSATTAAPTTTGAPTTTAAPATTVAPVAGAPTTTTTTLPAPALAVVQALPTASTPIVTDTSISTGEAITVSFGGFTPFEYVQLIVASTPQVIGSGYANAQGVVTISGNLPANLTSGNHTLAVYAPVSGVGFSQPITVSQPTLPATGSDEQSRLYVVALMLLVGGLLVRRTRIIERS